MKTPGRIPLCKRIRRIFSTFIRAPYLFEVLQNSVDELHQKTKLLDDHEQRLHSLETVEGPYLAKMSDRLIHDSNHISLLNRELSIHPVIWGKPEKLSISPSAAVFTCLFNTNSGTITIGDYTFAGSRVSILAGSHDHTLTGFLRRDAEIAEGCDIVIGKGVWLASNCTILGPCVIHDNAVVAAGAVVTPGTVIPANTIFGGVPAKEISRIDVIDSSDIHAPAILNAIDRCGGFLYVSGWSSRINEAFSIPGHWVFGDGVMLTKQKNAVMLYQLEDADTAELSIAGPNESSVVTVSSSAQQIELTLPVVADDLTEIHFRLLSSPARLLIALVSGEGTEIIHGR